MPFLPVPDVLKYIINVRNNAKTIYPEPEASFFSRS